MENFIPIPPPPPPQKGFTVSRNSVFRQFKDEVKEELKEEMKTSKELDIKENKNKEKSLNDEKNEKKIGKLNIPIDLQNKINSVYANRSNTKNTQEEVKSNEKKPIITEKKTNINNKPNNFNENIKKEILFENYPNIKKNDNYKEENNNISSINNRLVLEMSDNTINKIFEYTDKLFNKENNMNEKKTEEKKQEKEIKNNIIKNKSEFIILSTGFLFGYIVNYYVEHYDVFKLF